VQLVRHFRRACLDAGIACTILGLDCEPARASAAYYCDQVIAVPPGNHADFPEVIRQVVRECGVGLLIPLADTDLPSLAGIRQEVAELHCLPACCGPKTAWITRDKLNTYHWLRDLNLDTPHTQTLADALQSRPPLPAFVKPRHGSAGKNTLLLDSWQLQDWMLARADAFVVQEMLDGQEFTVDAFIDPDRRVHSVIPRMRLEVRGGEVVKSQVRMDPEIIRQATQVAANLPDAFGVINIQGFLRPSGQISWTEVNARFGGGSPLSIEAGARFHQWLVELALGRQPDYATSIADGTVMLRFDDAVYLDSAGTPRIGLDMQGPVSRIHPTAVSPRDLTGGACS
jgi:carbamoyl-phosphate synthase large subunit